MQEKRGAEKTSIMPIEDTTLQVAFKEGKLNYVSLRLPIEQGRQILAHAGYGQAGNDRPKVWTLFDPYKGVFMAFLHREDAERTYVELVRSTTPSSSGPPVTKEAMKDVLRELLNEVRAEKK